jgi:hypothetical protein
VPSLSMSYSPREGSARSTRRRIALATATKRTKEDRNGERENEIGVRARVCPCVRARASVYGCVCSEGEAMARNVRIFLEHSLGLFLASGGDLFVAFMHLRGT